MSQWAVGAVGSAPPWHGGGRGSESRTVHRARPAREGEIPSRTGCPRVSGYGSARVPDWAVSAVGSAPRSQRGGHRFDPGTVHFGASDAARGSGGADTELLMAHQCRAHSPGPARNPGDKSRAGARRSSRRALHHMPAWRNQVDAPSSNLGVRKDVRVRAPERVLGDKQVRVLGSALMRAWRSW